MLDEPSLGLAPVVVETIYKTVTDLRAHGKTSCSSSRTLPSASR
jgi:ABC-type branched-subunit amino acid transport system ATPase component